MRVALLGLPPRADQRFLPRGQSDWRGVACFHLCNGFSLTPTGLCDRTHALSLLNHFQGSLLEVLIELAPERIRC